MNGSAKAKGKSNEKWKRSEVRGKAKSHIDDEEIQRREDIEEDTLIKNMKGMGWREGINGKMVIKREKEVEEKEYL